MTKLSGSQLSLIAEIEEDEYQVGDWHYDELGTEEILVPNFSLPELGTTKSLVPNFSPPELGTNQTLVPNFPDSELGTNPILVPNFFPPELGTNQTLVPNSDEWKPPIGCLQQKWIKDHQYWYWRYYNSKGKKASLYLAKDYNKAIRKAKKIGVPPDAKLPNLPPPDPQTQAPTPTINHPLCHSQTTHRTSRDSLAA
jgi:hypothetical protein